MSPKAVGMTSDWDLCCDTCCQVKHSALSPYTYKNEHFWKELDGLREQFIRGEDETEIAAAVRRLAAQVDSCIKDASCPCGGHFSIAARPRCVSCNAIVFDSYFNYTYVSAYDQKGETDLTPF
jgi:hypothetical protein